MRASHPNDLAGKSFGVLEGGRFQELVAHEGWTVFG